MLEEGNFESVDDLCEFAIHCGRNGGPHSLVLLSAVCGHLESTLIESEKTGVERDPFPLGAEAFSVYRDFLGLLDDEAGLREGVETSVKRGDTRAAVKRVSDAIWSKLSNRFFKDKLHIQSVRALLIDGQLDCFGLALSIYLACQLLGVDGVRLTLSEDHSWISWEEREEGADAGGNAGARVESAEITWSGRAASRRANPIDDRETPAGTMWLYQMGGKYAVACSHAQVVAAIVTLINDECNLTGEDYSSPLVRIKAKMLQAIHKEGFTDGYPMSVYSLADCLAIIEHEQMKEKHGDEYLAKCDACDMGKECIQLFQLAMDMNSARYQGHHVYPFTAFGNYWAKQRKSFPHAVNHYADGTLAASKYIHTKTDMHLLKLITKAVKKLAELAKAAMAEELTKESCVDTARLVLGLARWEHGTKLPIVGEELRKHIATIFWAFPMDVREDASSFCLEATSVESETSKRVYRMMGEWLADRGAKRPMLMLRLEQVFGSPEVAASSPDGDASSSGRRRRRTARSSSGGSSEQSESSTAKRSRSS